MSKKKVDKKKVDKKVEPEEYTVEESALMEKVILIGKEIGNALAVADSGMLTIAKKFRKVCELITEFHGRKHVKASDVKDAKALLKESILKATDWKESSYAPSMSKLVDLAKLPKAATGDHEVRVKRSALVLNFNGSDPLTAHLFGKNDKGQNDSLESELFDVFTGLMSGYKDADIVISAFDAASEKIRK